MNRSLLALLLCAAAASILLSGCSWLPKETDETIGWSAQKLYGEAKDAMGGRSWEKAIKLLEKMEARYPYGRFAQQARLDVAYCYWKNNERASALAAADRFIKLYPNHANVDYAYYLKGLINFNENTGILSFIDSPDMTERDSKGTRESFEAFKELSSRFPDSKYTEDAHARMRYLVNALAQYEVHVARYYMKRSAFVAAANRAQYALKTYPQAPANEEGLVILVRAYDALGLKELRDDAERVLNKNFPDSKYLKGNGKSDTPWWQVWNWGSSGQ